MLFRSGIVIVAIVFLPMMRIGGMQFFRSESFDLSSDVVPRATEIAASLFYVYLVISVACVLAYSAAGMSGFDALAHAMTTVSTGGYGTYDSGFENFGPMTHYVAIAFMWLAALPFIRFVQLARGNTRGIRGDSQIQTFLAILLLVSTAMGVWRVVRAIAWTVCGRRVSSWVPRASTVKGRWAAGETGAARRGDPVLPGAASARAWPAAPARGGGGR